MNVQLRDYQSEAMVKIRSSFKGGNKRVMVYAPTGAGKNEISVAIAKLAQINGKKVLLLVHRKDLVKQQWERFAKYKTFPGILQGQNTDKPHSSITVGSIQTFSSRKKFGWQFDFDMIIIDEAHLCGGSKQYHELLRTHSNIPVIGLTATPFSKGLGKKMPWGLLFEDLIQVSTIQDLINKGFLVDCEIYAPSEPDLSKVRVVAGDYHQKQLGEAVNKTELVGDIVKHWFKLGNNKQTIVFATNIDHSKSIVEQFTAHGVAAEHVDCYTKEEHRHRAIDRFRSGEIKVLSNVSLFAEGFDAPETACMILARPTRSLIRYIQMIGRVLRPAEGKSIAIVLDHSGSVSRLGFPTDDLPLHLDTGDVKDAVKKENKPKEPKVCVSCKYVDRHRQHKCPKCGFAPVVKTKGIEPLEGTLQKIVKMPHEAKQQIYSALVAFAAMKNYQSGWISHKFKRITGVWPRDLKPEPGPIPDFVHKIIISEQIKFSYSKKRAA